MAGVGSRFAHICSPSIPVSMSLLSQTQIPNDGIENLSNANLVDPMSHWWFAIHIYSLLHIMQYRNAASFSHVHSVLIQSIQIVLNAPDGSVRCTSSHWQNISADLKAWSQRSKLLKTSAAAGALLLLALLGLWTGFHSRSSRAGRDHKALTGHVWHWVALLRCSVPFRVRGDHKTWWQGFTRSKPLALRMVQTTHCWHVGRHGVATICCVWWPCHVSSSIHSHWLRHNIGSTRHGPSLDRSGGHLVFHAAY